MNGQVEIQIFLDGRTKGHTRLETTNWLKEAATDVMNRAKISAPYDTGAMVRGIQIAKLTSRSAVVISTRDYSIYQEEGTSRGVPATKFMENAMNSTRGDYSGKLTFSKVI